MVCGLCGSVMGQSGSNFPGLYFNSFIYFWNPGAATTSQFLIQSESISDLHWTPAALYNRCHSSVRVNPQSIFTSVNKYMDSVMYIDVLLNQKQTDFYELEVYHFWEVHVNDQHVCLIWIFLAPPPEHQNYFGVDDNLGPVAVSIRREKLDDGKEKDGMQYNYRVTFRTSQVTIIHWCALSLPRSMSQIRVEQ